MKALSQTHELKVNNIRAVRKCFSDGNIWTKNELAEACGLSLAGTTNVLQQMLAADEIIYVGDADSTGGRKSKNYILNKDFSHIGTIILEKKDMAQIRSTVYNLFGEVLDQSERELNRIDDLDEQVAAMCADPKVKVLIISLPGVCVNGAVDVCDISFLEGMELISRYEERHGVKVIVENDVNVACIGLAESFPDIAHLAFVYQPAQDYVGCGMIVDHHLHNGFSHFAGELRYLPFYDHGEQDRLLKEDPQSLLEKQILTLAAVINPQVIGYCSDVFEGAIKVTPSFSTTHMPQLVRIEYIEEKIAEGTFRIGIRKLMEGEENGKVY